MDAVEGRPEVAIKRKEDLLARWNTTKGQASPNVSPYNSADEDSNRDEDIEAQESGEEGDEAAM